VPLPIFCVDAFTERPFAGNPAGVCLLGSAQPESWMRSVAAEMNLAETAFLEPRGDDFHLRWFTPTTEVDLCGHATLASAHVLWSEGRVPPDSPIRFHTRSGLLTAARAGEAIELDFPSEPPAAAADPGDLAGALGVVPIWIGRNRMDYLIEVASDEIVRGATPDMKALGSIEGRGVIVTARSTSPSHDFVSRFFGPAVGIDEDPVTGSAHCCLGPFWAERLGKTDLVGYQASARGGTVRVSVRGSRVRLGGRAVTVYRGQLLV
jgi:PhzF family phenazine biosynthesis protein